METRPLPHPDRAAPILIDPTQPGFVHRLARDLLAAGPVTKVEFPTGLVVTALTRDAELRSALADPRFVRGMEHWTDLAEGRVNPADPMVQMMRVDSMLVRNGADHTRIRKMLQPGFSRGAMQTLRPHIALVVDELLEDMATAPQPLDLKAAFAYPLTVRVLCHLLGLDPADAPRMGGLVRRAFSGTEPGATVTLRSFVAEVIDHKRRYPDDRMLSVMVTARDADGEPLTEIELIDNAMLLVVAGFETTMGALTNLVRNLLEHPDQLDAVRKGVVDWSSAIAEGLRHDGPVSALGWLFTTEEVTYPSGQRIGTGDAVLMCHMAANHDPARHGSSAAEFDVLAKRPSSLSFGHGAYACLGRPLAELELAQALPALFDRYPDLRLADTAAAHDPEPSVLMNHPKTLPVYLHPEPA